MKLLVAFLVLATVATACRAAESSGQQQQTVAVNSKLEPASTQADRQGRQIPSIGTGNQLSDGASNTIDHNTQFKKAAGGEKNLNPADPRQAIEQFMSPLNIIKTLVNLFFGKQDELIATSRSVLGVLNSALELLKQKFGKKLAMNKVARSAGSGPGGSIKVAADEMAMAGLSMLQGYVKSTLTTDQECTKRYLCEASRSAATTGQGQIGHLVSTAGAYVTSYLLSPTKNSDQMTQINLALRRGRDLQEKCDVLFPNCYETQPGKPGAQPANQPTAI